MSEEYYCIGHRAKEKQAGKNWPEVWAESTSQIE
jgi:hypothetical protein